MKGVVPSRVYGVELDVQLFHRFSRDLLLALILSLIEHPFDL